MEPSKKYLIHCIVWNVVGFLVLMSPALEIVSDILGDNKIFYIWIASVVISPLALLIMGAYLLWLGIPRRKLLVVGMVICALCLFIEIWVIDGLFMPPLSSKFFGGYEVVGDFCDKGYPPLPNYECPRPLK